MFGIEMSEVDLEARATKPNKEMNSLSHLFSRGKKLGHMKISSLKHFRPNCAHLYLLFFYEYILLKRGEK